MKYIICISVFLETIEEDDCPKEIEIRQHVIEKLFEVTKAHLEEWESLEEIWEEILNTGSQSAAKLAKFVSDETKGGNHQCLISLIRRVSLFT